MFITSKAGSVIYWVAHPRLDPIFIPSHFRYRRAERGRDLTLLVHIETQPVLLARIAMGWMAIYHRHDALWYQPLRSQLVENRDQGAKVERER